MYVGYKGERLDALTKLTKLTKTAPAANLQVWQKTSTTPYKKHNISAVVTGEGPVLAVFARAPLITPHPKSRSSPDLVGVDMEAQKRLRNSGFLPPLAADRVYDHNGAVPSTVRHAGRLQERPADEVSATLLSKKNKNREPYYRDARTSRSTTPSPTSTRDVPHSVKILAFGSCPSGHV